VSSSYAATCRKLHRLQALPFYRFVRLIQQTNGWGVLPAKTLRVSWRIHKISHKSRGRVSFSRWLKATGQSLAMHRLAADFGERLDACNVPRAPWYTGRQSSGTTKPGEER